MIEYCLNNVDAEVRTRLRALDDRTIERPCMQRCGDCWSGPFLVVDGERRCGSSHEVLIDRLETD